MRHQWIWLCVSGLILGSLVGCDPAVFSPPSDANATPQTRAPTSKTVASTATMEPTGTSGIKPAQPGSGTQISTVITLSSTPVIAEEEPMSSTLLAFPPESTERVKLAREDLARRLRVSVDSITVVVVIGQEFSTDAFYCRKTKDRIAKDAPPEVISGESILLSASGRRYEYHASGQTIVFCRPLS
jgi:hypothetical protein